LEDIDKFKFEEDEELDAFVDACDLLVEPSLVTQLQNRSREKVGLALSAINVDGGWSDGQVVGLLIVGILWGAKTIPKVREIAAAYSPALVGASGSQLKALLRSLNFTNDTSEWLVDNLNRMNKSHGHLIEHFQGQYNLVRPNHLEMAFMCVAEENFHHFLMMEKGMRSKPHMPTLIKSLKNFPRHQ